jgi:hypothetical protein
MLANSGVSLEVVAVVVVGVIVGRIGKIQVC